MYLSEPDATTDDELICDIAFPLGELHRCRSKHLLGRSPPATKPQGSLPSEVDEHPPEIVRVLLDAVVLGLYLLLVEETQYPLFQLA